MCLFVNVQKKIGTFQLQVQFESQARRIGILGVSGCGKSMTLKSIAGIETPDIGKIQVGNQILFSSAARINVKPQKRRIGYLFQNYALFPTMTVSQNIAAGLKGSRQEKQERVQEMIRKFRLEGLEEQFPEQLSGGQQQRTALARIMAYEPEMLLLDEPFSALDVLLKDRLQWEMMELLEEYRGTVILVSHSRDEIFRFSEELLIMAQGKVITYGKTKRIFANPGTREAARLTGCKNFSRIHRQDGHTALARDWGISLHVEQEIPVGANYIGYRAHDFEPVWGKRRKNCIKVQVGGLSELPFERNYYLLPERKGGEIPEWEKNRTKIAEDISELVCWFVQKEKWSRLKEKGLPDYLELKEEYMMFLE